MGINYSPRIVTDGLVLCLDAGNVKSYPGSGTAWNDLSGNGNNGTLVNGPTFSGVDGGSITIDAINDNVNLGTNSNIRNFYQNNTSFTLDCFVKKSNTTNNSNAPLGFALFSNNDGGWVQGWSIYIRNSNELNNNVNFQIGYASTRNAVSYDCPYGLIENIWTHVVVTHSVISLNSNCSFYKNGNLVQSFSSSVTALGTSNIYNNIIGRQTSISWQGHNSQGQISTYKIYNRALTAQEIQQNFNATRSRYGI